MVAAVDGGDGDQGCEDCHESPGPLAASQKQPQAEGGGESGGDVGGGED